MAGSVCDMLDEYLGGWLKDENRQVFESHLAKCVECSSQVELQSVIDDLLVHGDEMVEPPFELVHRIETVPKRRLIRRLVALTTVVAAILIAVGIYFVADEIGPKAVPKLPVADKPQPEVEQIPEIVEQTPIKSKPVAIVETSSNAIAVEIKTDSPDVYVFRIYPTLNVANNQTAKPNSTTPTEGSEL